MNGPLIMLDSPHFADGVDLADERRQVPAEGRPEYQVRTPSPFNVDADEAARRLGTDVFGLLELMSQGEVSEAHDEPGRFNAVVLEEVLRRREQHADDVLAATRTTPVSWTRGSTQFAGSEVADEDASQELADLLGGEHAADVRRLVERRR